MPTLVAVDVSVIDDRISLVFSHRDVAQAYAKYLKSEDARSSYASTSSSGNTYHTLTSILGGYRRDPRLNLTSKQVTLALPSFITWFITCRLPDDEDSVTFTFMDQDERHARAWADSMVLFEPVPPSHSSNYSDDGASDAGVVKQLHVRRLWNRAKLLKGLDEMRRTAPHRQEVNASSLARLPLPVPVSSTMTMGGMHAGMHHGMMGGGMNGMQSRNDIWW